MSNVKFDIGDTVYWHTFDGIRSGIVYKVLISKDGVDYDIKCGEYNNRTNIQQELLINKEELNCAQIQLKVDETTKRIKILCEYLKGLRKDYKEAKKIQLIEKLARLK